MSSFNSLLEKKRQELRQLQNELQAIQLKASDLKKPESDLPIPSPKASVSLTQPSPVSRSSTFAKIPKNSLLDEQLGNDLISNFHLDDIRRLFMHYSSLNNIERVDSLQLNQFHKLLEEFKLYTPKINRVKADLLFCKNNRSKSISFDRFIEILTQFAISSYPSDGKFSVFEKYVLHQVLPKAENMRNFQMDVEGWESEIEGLLIHPSISQRLNTLQNIFKLYSNIKNTVNLQGFLGFCQDLRLTPGLLTIQEIARLFRNITSDSLFNQELTYEEFQNLCGVLSLYVFKQPAFMQRCHSSLECFETLFTWIESNMNTAGR